MNAASIIVTACASRKEQRSALECRVQQIADSDAAIERIHADQCCERIERSRDCVSDRGRVQCSDRHFTR